MFMAFATEYEEYQSRVYDCVQAVKTGTPLEHALCEYEVEYEDFLSMYRFAQFEIYKIFCYNIIKLKRKRRISK